MSHNVTQKIQPPVQAAEHSAPATQAGTPVTPKYKFLSVGDPAPWFTQRCTSNEEYGFDTAAGRYIVMCFFASTTHDDSKNALSILDSHRKLFDDKKISFFGVCFDPTDERDGYVKQTLPGIRHFWDFNGEVGRLYGVLPINPGVMRVRPQWFVLDPQLRIIKMTPFRADGGDKKEIVDFLKKLPPVDKHAGLEIMAPVLFLPNVFEPEFCQKLIHTYETGNIEDSGFMRQVGAKTLPVMDYKVKRRSDVYLTDDEMIKDVQFRIRRRINPEIEKAYAFHVTRLERYLVACYDSETGGHFRAHRDNRTTGTAHRRFAVSINLNDEFEGGEISFPEYGARSFKPPVGGAVVFNCSLLHEVSPVRKGKRYAFLPFLYDEEAAKIRVANQGSLEA